MGRGRRTWQGPLTGELPDALITACEALGTQFLPEGFDHRATLRPALLQVGSIGLHRGSMGVVALIHKLFHPRILAYRMRMKVQMLRDSPLGPILGHQLPHSLIHLQLPTALLTH